MLRVGFSGRFITLSSALFYAAPAKVMKTQEGEFTKMFRAFGDFITVVRSMTTELYVRDQ